jgi:glycosyl transferase family 61
MDIDAPARSARALATDAGGIYEKIHDVRKIEYAEPKGLEGTPDTFGELRNGWEPETYVAVVPEGRLCGEGDHNPPTWHAPSSVGSEECSVDDQTYIPETVAALPIRPSWSPNYFHWMFQVLPRLSTLKASGIAIGKYLTNMRKASFQHETLGALGVEEADVIELGPRYQVTARQLAMPSAPPTIAPRWVCEFLKSAFLVSPPANGEERIYLSRATAVRGRGVTNEDQIREVLAKFRFREFVPDQVSVAEQAEVFASASVVVGPHGAALTNLVFCKPGTTVIEFFAPKYVHPAYWMISSQCSLDYHYLVGRGERAQSWTDWPRDEGEVPNAHGVDAIEVDADKLVKLLTMAGL